PSSNRHLHSREAVLRRTVVIVIQRVARGLRGTEIRLDQRIGVARLARCQRTTTAAIFAGAILPTFLLAEIWQHVVIGPTDESIRGPAVIIAAVAAHVGHRID